MARSTQFMGLSERADLFLAANVQEESPSDECVLGMFDEPIHQLMRYILKDGQVVEEYIEAEPWSSGPMIYLALRDATTKEPIEDTLWDIDLYDQEHS